MNTVLKLHRFPKDSQIIPDVEESSISSAGKRFGFPQSGHDGCFEYDGRVYGTVNYWTKQAGVGKKTLKRYLEEMNAVPKNGLDRSGRKRAFFSEDDIDAVLEMFRRPKADATGFFELDGKRYATIKVLKRTAFSSVHESVIVKRIAQTGLEPIEGLTCFNRHQSFYAEADVREILRDDLVVSHAVDRQGFARIDGALFGTERAWRQRFQMGSSAWRSRQVKSAALRVKNHQGKRCAVYAEEDVRFACRDIIELACQANRHGFFIHNGEKYGTRNAWSNVLELSINSISKRVDERLSIDGRDASGTKGIFFSESHLLDVCADLLDKPKADGKGYLFEGGERYGIQSAICRDFNVTWAKVEACIKGKNIRMIQGKNRATRDSIFYAVQDILRDCAEVIRMPKADEFGVFHVDKERFATRKRWNMLFDLPHHRIERLLSGAEVQPIKGLDVLGHKQDFYGELDVRCVIAEHSGDDAVAILMDNLPRYRVQRSSTLHRGLAGDTIRVFPRRFNARIEEALQAFGIGSHVNQRIGVIKGRPIVLHEHEIV